MDMVEKTQPHTQDPEGAGPNYELKTRQRTRKPGNRTYVYVYPGYVVQTSVPNCKNPRYVAIRMWQWIPYLPQGKFSGPILHAGDRIDERTCANGSTEGLERQ
jgi:hypothetical protein